MKLLIEKIDQGSWTKKQKKRQKNSILSNVALCKTLIEAGIPKEQSYELVKEYSFHVAGKFHGILKALFYIPGFFRLFRFFMRKGMAGTEIWISDILTDNSREYSMDVLKCLWFDTCSHFGCPELCEIFCLCDHIVFGNIGKLQFDRSQTLGMGGDKCDFCFRSKKLHGIAD
ncbi:MAG: L-2-amino-thiazoline-4-carboxylic acid hydrolase [[Eubacterium] brachy]|nr:L-2-amino-thiazoline-4-carboxylic acid hydrolase [[Eubacterium] brachy]